MNDTAVKTILKKLSRIEASIVEFKKETRERFDGIDKRLDGIDKRLDGVDKRLDGVDKRFDGVDKRFDGVDKRFDDADKRFDDADKRFDGVDKRFDKFAHAVSETFVTRVEFEDFERYVRENMFTKKDFMDHMSQLDEIYMEFKRTRDNNILIGKQLCDLDDTVFSHGKRITALEDKVLK